MSSTEELRAGLAGYAHEQAVFRRLLKKRGSFTETEFDRWVIGREMRRPLRRHPVLGSDFVLGMGRNGGSEWARQLDLLQYMVALGDVDTATVDGKVVYRVVD